MINSPEKIIVEAITEPVNCRLWWFRQAQAPKKTTLTKVFVSGLLNNSSGFLVLCRMTAIAA